MTKKRTRKREKERRSEREKLRMKMNTKCVSMLLLALLFAATTNHVAEAVISAPEPSTPRDNGQGWYFSEFSIRVGTNPGPGMSEERCLCAAPALRIYTKRFPPFAQPCQCTLESLALHLVRNHVTRCASVMSNWEASQMSITIPE